MDPPKQNIVLGLGNTMHGDDGIGIWIVEKLQHRLQALADVWVTEEMGLRLLDFLSGYRTAVIVDSVKTEQGVEGELHFLNLSDFAALPYCGCHQVGLPEMALLAETMGIPFPETVHILGIEIEDPYRVGNTLSPSLKKKVPLLMQQVEKKIERLLGG